MIKEGQLLYGTKDEVKLQLEEKQIVITSIANSKKRRVASLEEVFAVKPLFHHKEVTDQHLKEYKIFGIYLLDLESEKLQRLTFTAESHEEARDWIDSLLKAVFRVDDPSVIDASKRRVLLILNPTSGLKKGRQLFNKIIKPMWDMAHMQYTVVETSSPQHALKMCSDASQVDLSQYTDIIAGGGDGSLYEVINGCMNQILNRPNKDVSFADIRFGVIPTGTSNGLAAAIGCAKKNGGRPSVARAALIIARGFYQPFDILSAFQKDERRFFFLSVTWGLIADADLGTENMRWMGSMRNLVGALRGIVKQKYLHGKIKFLENGSNAKHTDTEEEVKKMINSSYLHQRATSDSLLQSGEKSYPICNNLLKYFEEDFKTVAPSYYEEQKKLLASLASSQPSDAVPQQPQENEDPEVHIKSIEDHLFMFVASNVSHIAHDCKIAPKAQLSDGSIDLVLVRDKTLSRFGMTKIFLGVEDGSFFQNPAIEFTKVSSFVLTPVEQGSFIAIDGEHGHYDSVIVDIHKGLVNLLTW